MDLYQFSVFNCCCSYDSVTMCIVYQLLHLWFKGWIISIGITNYVRSRNCIEKLLIFFVPFPPRYLWPSSSINIFLAFVFSLQIFRLPFNWKTPFGYVIAVIFISAACFATLYVLTLTLSFYASSCWLFIFYVKDISNDVSFLAVGGQSNRCHRKMKERFCKIVQLNSIVKQLSEIKKIDQTTEIYIYYFNFVLADLLMSSMESMNL